ncbi:hypothetical protein ANCDUO_01590 [Ancylostoma duodenale]|uniref:Uncharacterized protein n=1 Tax=Ancylostoma duodenale TaxID=51022 RepID=A0A0C2DDS2_9BILA|nr:hypothetical protein ANCDUO_01590 [Ancylostoma duodenale]
MVLEALGLSCTKILRYLKLLGNWSERTGWLFDSRYANKWEFDIDPEADDLAGLHLRVVVYLSGTLSLMAQR